MKEKNSERVKMHQEYRTSTGRLVPGASTIAGMDSNIDILMAWAVKLTKQGIDYRKYREEKADIGTCVHEMILCHYKEKKINTDKYSKEVIDKAENSFLSFLAWEKKQKIDKIISVEESHTSDIMLYGGTWDLYGIINGITTLIDFKSGNGIWDNHWWQLAGYERLIEEKYLCIVNQNIILNIPRTEDDNFKEEMMGDLEMEFEVFKSYLKAYHLKNEIKRIRKGEDSVNWKLDYSFRSEVRPSPKIHQHLGRLPRLIREEEPQMGGNIGNNNRG